jgi:hypothetical protein
MHFVRVMTGCKAKGIDGDEIPGVSAKKGRVPNLLLWSSLYQSMRPKPTVKIPTITISSMIAPFMARENDQACESSTGSLRIFERINSFVSMHINYCAQTGQFMSFMHNTLIKQGLDRIRGGTGC